MSVIYDLGANRGDNLPYFLSRADLVVAVEANPALVREMNSKYSNVINDGRLKVINCALSDCPSDSIPFSVNLKDSHISALNPSGSRNSSDFEVIGVPAMTIVDLIANYGNPYYIKIDLEGYDSCVLSQLFEAKIFPDYLSAEAHTTLPFALIDESGIYNSYQIMDARKFSAISFACPGQSDVNLAPGCFHEGTSGPFGADIPSPWMSSRQCLTNLAIAGLGWRDIHARKQHPDSDARVYLENFPLRSLASALARKLVPNSWLKPKFFM